MPDIILKADATFGLRVKTGDRVEKGKQIGTSIQTGKPLLSPTSGIIESISFNPHDHTFEIHLKTDR
jgi:Na+-translocating ferredoxin:NAD+ oxidoreductase RnfC subunit